MMVSVVLQTKQKIPIVYRQADMSILSKNWLSYSVFDKNDKIVSEVAFMKLGYLYQSSELIFTSSELELYGLLECNGQILPVYRKGNLLIKFTGDKFVKLTEEEQKKFNSSVLLTRK